MNCLFPAFCDKKYKYLQHPAWLSCRQNIVASFLVIVMHEEPPLVKILLDHMFLEEFAVVGFIWLIISHIFAIV